MREIYLSKSSVVFLLLPVFAPSLSRRSPNGRRRTALLSVLGELCESHLFRPAFLSLLWLFTLIIGRLLLPVSASLCELCERQSLGCPVKVQ